MKIAIVGAGLMGRLTALSLIRKAAIESKNIQLSLFDKDDKLAYNSAAYAAAGLLTPLGESLHCEANIVEMGFKAIALWPELLDSLDEYTIFQQAGAIMVSHEQDKGDYQRFVRHLQNNYPEQQVHSLNRKQLTELEPELGRSFNQGLYLPQEGQVGNRRLLVALRKQLEQEGSKVDFTWRSECNVVAITDITDRSDIREGQQVSYQTQGEAKQQQHFDLVIDCRGTGASSAKANNDNAPLPDLRSVRGELFQLYAPDVHLIRPIRLMHPRYQLYIAPKQKGFYVVGATEIESDDDAPMTVRSAMELLSAAYSVHPGFAEANIRQHVSQSRPAFSDNQPRISVQKSLIQVNGLFRHGFLIAPVVLKQLMAVIDNITTESEQALPYADLLPVSYQQTANSVELI